MRARTWVVTVAAGLVLADASIVTLALPELLGELDTTVEGVAAVIAVYTLCWRSRCCRRSGRAAARRGRVGGVRVRPVRARLGRRAPRRTR